MKVVLFCGGLGMRMRPLIPDPHSVSSYISEDLPKPMVHVGGQRPLLWNVMKYYAHYGHKDFILCLGFRGDVIKNYFLNYNEYLSNDFIMEDGGAKLNLLHGDIQDWRMTFADTGLTANVGQRLCAVKSYLKNETMFLANYSDGLTDVPLDEYLEKFKKTGKVAAFVCVRPPHTSHVVRASEEGNVTAIEHIREAGVWINGGYFIFRKEIFDYIHEGEELVEQPFRRLIEANQLFAFKYDGFWACIDTFKEKQALDEMIARGLTPWKVWGSDAKEAMPTALEE
ncbi:MAG: glucose-1-phosphate cytidylyltransferase [Candidatus Hydrogenedentes bacterium]|nr:glucose-1-phosphate cytidylyltransferase [Candidatus Hydrogenedentota bacterium]